MSAEPRSTSGPRRPQALRATLTTGELRELRILAIRRGSTVQDEAGEAVRQYLAHTKEEPK